MGDQWYRNALEETFGFGLKTNIELPAESPGLLPTPGKLHPNGKLEWSVPTPYSMAFGHNIMINSIQMVRAFAVIANGGYLVQPHIVRKIVRKKVDGSQEIVIDRTGALMPKPEASAEFRDYGTDRSRHEVCHKGRGHFEESRCDGVYGGRKRARLKK